MNPSNDNNNNEKKPSPPQTEQKRQQPALPATIPAAAQERNEAVIRAERARIMQIQKGKCNF